MKRYGLIGHPLSHSFSQQYFTEKFKSNILLDHSYDNFDIGDLIYLKELVSVNNLSGFNITIPHKQSVISFLDDKDEVVKEINACNCVKIVNGRWTGYNTDVIGFKKSFSSNLLPHHTNALVLGTGGSSKAIEYVLRKLNIKYLLVSSSKAGDNVVSYNDVDEVVLKKHTIVINTTPVGMFPHIGACPQIPFEFVTAKHYFFDLVYNPERTLFLQKAQAKGAIIQNGYNMLIEQAEESWQIWNND